jgi:geranylgeranyl diphosphate synthase type II
MTENFHFEKKLQNDIKLFSKKFKEIISDYTQKIPYRFKKAIFYSLFPGGKRIRPILMFSCGEMLGVKKEALLYPACSIELIHNYSLIHDDLPSMDNDDYRRGKLTLHKKFDEATAILVGDGLLTLAFEILCSWKQNLDVVVKVIKLISNYVGINGLIEGQILDISATSWKNINNNQRTKKYVEKMCIKKTAKLIEASILVAGIVKKLKIDKLKILQKIGTNIGLLFQITDDLIDYTSGQDKEKLCYPKVFGIEETKKIIQKLSNQTKNLIIKNFGQQNSQYLQFLINKISKREK